MSVEAFIQAARSLKGAQWRHLGRTDRHIDCIGLLAVSFGKAGLPFEDERVYSREPVGGFLLDASVKRYGDQIPKQSASAGDLVLLKWSSNTHPSHAGILANHPDGGLSIIHASHLHGVVEHRWSGTAYERKTSHVFRWTK